MMKCNRREYLGRAGMTALVLSCFGIDCRTRERMVDEDRPNILWITSEDNSSSPGCYGDSLAYTPNLDRLASEGVRFTHAFANAPVCSSARSTLITGMYSIALGIHHHRSGHPIPESFMPYPVYLRRAGYYCTNNNKKNCNLSDDFDCWHESSRTAHYLYAANALQYLDESSVRVLKSISRRFQRTKDTAACRTTGYLVEHLESLGY